MAIDAETSLTQYRLRARLSPEAWREVLELELFNLTPEVRNPGDITGDGDVEIELRLADAEVPAVVVAVAGMSPRESVLYLAGLGAEDELPHPVLVTESWFLLTATEEIELPPEVEGTESSLRSGFTTTWTDAEAVDPTGPEIVEIVEERIAPEDEPWPELLGVVRDYLDDNGIAYLRHQGADMVSADVEGDHGPWSMWIHTRETARQVLVYSIRPEVVDEASRAEVAGLIGLLNARMLTGNFEMDADGGFRCRTSLIVNDAALDDQLLDGLVPPNLMAMDRGLGALEALLAGTPVDQALEHFPPPTR